jgi:hypothetical protein
MPSGSVLTEISLLLKSLINGRGSVSNDNNNNTNDDKGTDDL